MRVLLGIRLRLGIGIGHRCLILLCLLRCILRILGGIGFYSSDVAREFNVSEGDLPSKFGAGCNYMGGGIRGSIFGSTFNKDVPTKAAMLLCALAEACVRVYESVENESQLNNEEYSDGDTNWDAIATKSVRKTGVISAY